ncbi:MAG: hypothetical protein CVU11_01715 [Bacteroidetes bacterium HGW-Bacteroidetes-6]|jgi:cell division protein ZapA|nr:MAG: hypothetical protein CVU11_01715 [Bacteroidetes bacterium HGW-Bacteroidetes-6]
MKELVKISVTVANRKYTLSVENEDEILIRNAAETINNKVKEFLLQFPGKDMQDIMAMTLLNYAASLGKSDKQNSFVNEELHSRLQNINQLLVEAV